MSNQQRMAIHRVVSLTLIALLSACSAPGLWTYEKAGSAPTSAAAAGADPRAYAESVWGSKVIPTVSQSAVDAGTLLGALTKNATAAAGTYGLASPSGGAPTFMIKGHGVVSGVETSDPQGLIKVDVGAGHSVYIVTGPVITGTALRDAIQVNFGDFTNQIAFQKVATELNNKVKNEVVKGLDLASLTGATLDFEGAFSGSTADHVNVVPTKLTVAK